VKPLSHPPAGTFSVRVYYEDTDFSGCVYHASYLRFLERGRTEWLRGHGAAHRDFAESSGVFFAVRSLQIDYLAPALMDDLLRVETGVSALRGASIEFRQRIVRHDKELVTAQVLVAAIRAGPRREFPLPCAVFSPRLLDA
jgi:acyl-CoA thioester hydrolase